MKKLFVRILLLCFFTSATALHAQQELGLNFMNQTWESSLTNPAMTTDKKLTVILPSVYFSVGSPDLTVRNLTIVQNGQNVFNLDSAASHFKAPTHFNANISVQTLGIAFKAKNWTFSISNSLQADGATVIPKQLVQAIVQGNSQFIGQTASVGINLQAYAYSQIGFGAACQVTDGLTIGAKVKYLSGLAGVFTPSSQVSIYTDTNVYALTFNNNYDVRTFSSNAFTALNNNPASFALQNLFSGNSGYSFDLGAKLKLGKLELGASAIDLGGTINWKENAVSYKTIGTYTYTGTSTSSISQFFNLSYLTNSSFKDTLKNVVNLIQGTDAYVSKLPTKIYLTAAYQLNDNTRLGALLYNESGNGNTYTDLAFSANYRILHFITIGAVYSLRNNTFNNLGANLVLQLGPAQVYALTDNILTAFSPYTSNSANARIGANLMF